MKKLTSSQAKYLRGLAHGLQPIVFIGQKGITDAVIKSAQVAFDRHELIKVKFVEFKEKKQKKEMAVDLQINTGSYMVGIIGHVAIFYKPQEDPKKRKINLAG